MKKLIKIILLSAWLALLMLPLYVWAWTIGGLDFWNNSWIISWWTSSLSDTIITITKRFLSLVKNIFSWVLLIILVYSWARMVMSFWSDEEALSESKRIIWYSIIALFFVNMPSTLYEAIRWNRWTVAWWVWSSWDNSVNWTVANLFINTDIFSSVLNNIVVRTIKIGLVWLSVVVIILAGITIMTARGREDKVSEWKQKILWALVALVFVWFIEAWQSFVYSWNISDWRDIFETIANLALFLAAPTVIVFLSLAWYYYITSAWDEEKANKWKTIIVNTLIWIVLLLISFVFLYDLILV